MKGVRTGRVAQIGEPASNGQQDVWVWCPGCDQMHPFRVAGPGTAWAWNGDLDCPTFSPSLLCYSSVHLCEGEHDPDVCERPDSCEEEHHQVGALVDGVVIWRLRALSADEYETVYGHSKPHTREPAMGTCHSFVREGRWEFLSDSAHALAGQTVPLPPVDDWPWRFGAAS